MQRARNCGHAARCHGRCRAGRRGPLRDHARRAAHCLRRNTAASVRMKRPSILALRTAYDAQHALLVDWLTRLPSKLWHQPSALDGWAVRQLAFHTTEVPGSLTRALAAGPVRERPLTIG